MKTNFSYPVPAITSRLPCSLSNYPFHFINHLNLYFENSQHFTSNTQAMLCKSTNNEDSKEYLQGKSKVILPSPFNHIPPTLSVYQIYKISCLRTVYISLASNTRIVHWESSDSEDLNGSLALEDSKVFLQNFSPSPTTHIPATLLISGETKTLQ